MKLKYLYLLIIMLSANGYAQSIFSENMGTPTGTTSVSSNAFQNGGILIYGNGGQTGSADVRSTSPSSGYGGASGGGNVFFSSTISACGFSIGGINASNFSSLTLSFGYRKESLSSHAAVSVDYWNGSAWTTIANSASTLFNEAVNAGTGWYASKLLSIPQDGQIDGLIVRFVKSGTGSIRVDDVKLTGVEILPSVTNSTVGSITSYSALFSGIVTDTGGYQIVATGTVFSQTAVNPNPALGGSQVTNISTPSPSSGAGSFANASGPVLLPNVQYSYNAYATKSTGATGYGAAATFYTLAVDPSVPIVSNTSAMTTDIAVGNDANSPMTTYAFLETSTGYFVQVDGSLGVSPFYQLAAAWGTKTVTGLTPSTNYIFKSIAKNGDNLETNPGPSAATTTLAMPAINVSGAPSGMNATYGEASNFTTFSISGVNLTGVVMVSAPAGFEISVTPNGLTGYDSVVMLSPISGLLNSTTVYIRLSALTPAGIYNGNIIVSSVSDNVTVSIPMVLSTVAKRPLSISGISILNKQFDGNTAATITGYPNLSGVLSGDEPSMVFQPDNAFANFIDPLVGSGKSVVVEGYSISGAAALNYQLEQPTNLVADITSNAGSDFIMNNPSPTNENANINYLTYQGTQLTNTGSGTNGSIGVMGFYLRDGGENDDLDDLPTELTSISFDIVNPQLIKAARLFVGTSPRGNVVMVNGQSTITFNNLTDIAAPDNGQLAINLRVTFNSEVADNEQFIFIISGATASASGSTFAEGNGGGLNSVSDGDINRLEVVGQNIEFVQQPPLVVAVNAAMTPAPTLVIKDQNGNVDFDINEGLFVVSSSPASTVPYVASSFVDGLYSFNGITHILPGTNFHLTADSSNLSPVNSTTFTVSEVGAPVFPVIGPVCEGGSFTLPATSLNGFSGTWSPQPNVSETTTYTFTPNPGQNATNATVVVEITPNVIPEFYPVAPINIGDTISPLPTTSNNGITGTWTPALDNTQTTTYTFTPDSGFCATQTTLTVNVYDSNTIIPAFNAVAPICVDGHLSELPTTSNNGILGSWSPPLDSTMSTTYTFTPDAGQNAVSTVLTILVTPLTLPSFNSIPTIAHGTTFIPTWLPGTSLNGITGAWTPSFNNTVTTTYIFTPDLGQCASSTSMTIQVQQPAPTPVYPILDTVVVNNDGTTTTIEAPVCLTDTKGELSVSSSGTPFYRVPIAIPAGIRDVAPQIALEYSGSSVQGIAGMGWNLNGISSIVRVSSRLDLDGVIDPVDFDDLDRYALDGQRLVAVSGAYGAPGTTYRTENYTNMKIEPAGPVGTLPGSNQYGPQSFVVTFPDGTQAFYGVTSDSRGLFEWKINRWIDPQGNYIDYTYFTENQVTRLTKIIWGRNINSPILIDNSIEFLYKDRLRAEYSYVHGTEVATKKILSSITVKSDSQIFRTYTIGHQVLSANYQRVSYIMESAGDNTVSNPIYFEYGDTPNGLGELTQTTSITGSQIDDIDVSGDFDGDGRVDFVANNKVYLSPIDLGNNWYGINFTTADKYVPVSVLDNGKLNQFQSVFAITENQSQTHYLLFSYSKTTGQMNLKNSFVSPTLNYKYCSTNGSAYTPCDFDEPDHLKSTYLEGDFDGDGITEVVHIRPIIKKQTTITQFTSTYVTFPPHYTYNYTVDGYTSYLFNLKDNLRIENSSFSYFGNRVNYCADFNGDGRTDILSINRQTKAYSVHQYDMASNQLQLLFSGTFVESIMAGDKIKQVVLGDFNGDSKMDIMIPTQSGQSSWGLYTSKGSSFKYDLYSNFELYQPHWQGAPTANRKKIRTYRAADLNKDGKSDFISTEWESWNESVNNRNSRGYIRYKENVGSLNTKPTFSANQEKSIYSIYEDPINCLVGDFKNPLANFEFTFIQRSSIWKGQYNKDFELEATLSKVKEVKKKITTEIWYSPLVPSTGLGTVNDIYHSNTAESYPYTEMISVPSMKVVNRVMVYDGSFHKTQLYKYYGLVIHSGGLGVIGFKKVAKSSWFSGVNPDKIWSCVQSNPQLLGQKIYEWSYKGDDHASFTNPPILTHGENDLGISINTYTSSTLSNNIRLIVPNKTVKTDFLTGLSDQTEYFYDSYWNVERTLYTNGVGTKEIVNARSDNPNGVGRLYAIGRLLQVNETIQNYGDTYTTERKYQYDPAQPNLVSQFQQKGHNTDYITEDYQYDLYGNVTQKSISAPNVTTRTIKDTYDNKGRFVIEKIDHEGFISKLEYNKMGQVTKAIDPLNVITITNYNAWGMPTGIAVTGASTSTKSTVITYSRDSSGTLVTTTTNVNTNEVSRLFVNRLGQNFKTTTKGFGADTWISRVSEFDFLGRRTRESEPYLDSNPDTGVTAAAKWNYVRYDFLSRPYEQESFNGRIQYIEYEGLVTTTTDGPKTIEVTYDANGNKRIVKDNNETINFNYYANGKLKETIYGNHTINYNYDGWGRNTYMKDPSVSQTAYTNTYNNFGEMLTSTTPTGTTTITYSPTGRIEQKLSVGQNTNVQSTFTYNAKGLPVTESGTSNGKSFTYTNTYNSIWQLTNKKEVTPDNFTHLKGYTYDGQGRVLQEQTKSYMTNNPSVNNGDVTIEYGYNSYNGMVDQYKDVATNTVLWKQNSANERLQLLTATFGNGIQVSNTFDPDYYFENISHTDGTNVALNVTYDFVRDRGTLTWRENNVQGLFSWHEDFTYDGFERLTNWTDPTGTSSNTYASDGRITANSAVGTFNYEDASRYRRTTADLNANGESLYLTRTPQNITYNMFKNPVSITEVSRGSVNFEYNLGRERSKSVVLAEDGTTIKKNKFYSGISEVELTEKPNQTLQFITYIAGSPYDTPVAFEKTYTSNGGGYTPSTQEFLYLHRDYQGTILAISGDNGVIKERRIFDPWGNLKKKYVANSAVPDANLTLVDFELMADRGYTGHEHFFSVGIIHMNARIYDPMLRSFLSCDSQISYPDNAQNYNRYAYALNNPLMYVDYDGNDPVSITIGAAIIIGAALGATVYIGMAFYTGSFSWGGLAKSIVVGAASGAASFGVGQLVNSLSISICNAAPALTQLKIDLMLAIPQAAMHGLSQGFIQGISGGDRGQTFITAAISSVAAGGYVAAAPKFATKDIGQVLFGTFAGGVTASLAGGNFWEGAITGFTVSLLNHYGHRIADEVIQDDIATKATKSLVGKPTAGNDSIQTIIDLPESNEYYTMAHKPKVGSEIRYDSNGPPKGTNPGDYAHTNMETGNISIYKKAFGSWKTLYSKMMHEFSHRFDVVHGLYKDWKDSYDTPAAKHLSEVHAYNLESVLNGNDTGLRAVSFSELAAFRTKANLPNYQIQWRQ